MKTPSSSRAILFMVVAILSVSVLPIRSFSQVTFERTYGRNAGDYGYCVNQTPDKGYVVVGTIWFYPGGSIDVYLIKTDSLGDTLWTSNYGGDNTDGGNWVERTSDQGYIIVGGTWSFGAGALDVYLVRTDSLGGALWGRTYGGPQNDRGHCVRQTADGGFVITGGTVSSGSEDVYLLRTDSLGNLLWERTYGESPADVGWSVIHCTDGGYAIVGETWRLGTDTTDIYLVKTDSLGMVLWTMTYGGTSDDRGYSIEQSLDGGYVIAGNTSSFGAGGSDVYLIKTDSLGNTAWTRTYGGVNGERGTSVQMTSDGGFIIAGYTNSFGAGDLDLLLLKTDSLGNTEWMKTYGGISNDQGYCVRETSDGGYIVAGWTYSFGAGSFDVYLVKTDAGGEVGVTEGESKTRTRSEGFFLRQNTPNPFHRSTLISYSLPKATTVTLSIYDITGRLVETLVNETQQPGIHQVRWDRKANPSGVYFYRLNAGEFVETRKMVVVE